MKVEPHIEELLVSYFSGTLSKEGKQELVAWLRADEEHQTIFSKMSDYWGITHIPLFASIQKENFEDYYTQLRSKEITKQKKNTYNQSKFWKMVASVFILLSIASLSYFIGKNDIDKEEITFYESITPLGSKSEIILPDNSIVWLNAGSSIKYSNTFSKKDRIIYLSGEAYFEVSKNTSKLFIVKTSKLDVVVTGTSFNVKAYDEDPMINIGLINGKVNIHLNQNDIVENYRLKPTDLFSYNKEKNKIDITENNKSSRFGAWKEGIINFDNMPFEQIAKDLNRNFNINIIIQSPVLKSEIFSGSFPKYATLDEIIKEIDIDRKYTWKQNGNKLIIKDK